MLANLCVVSKIKIWHSTIICAVFTANAVVTGEVNCYNFIVRFRSLPRFAETIGQEYVVQRNYPVVALKFFPVVKNVPIDVSAHAR